MSEKTVLGFTLALKLKEEARLSQVFQAFADDSGCMRLPEFILLCLSKHLISNQTPMYNVLNVFRQAAGEKLYLDKDCFFFAISLLSRIIFPEEIAPLELILTKLLMEFANETENVLPILDEKIKMILNERIIKIMETAEEGLLNILVSYNSQSIISGRKVVGIKQIRQKNLGIIPRNLVRFLKSREGVIPKLFSIETLNSVIQEVSPAKSKNTEQYYSNDYLIKLYEKEAKNAPLSSLKVIKGEPSLNLFDLQILLCKLAILSFPSIDDPAEQVYELLQNKLKLISSPKIIVKYSLDLVSDSHPSEEEVQKKTFQQYSQKKVVGMKNFKQDLDITELIKNIPLIPIFEEVEKMFDDERVPGVPDENVEIPENPPPYALPPIQYPLKITPQVKINETPKKEQKNARSETPAVKLKFVKMPGKFTSKTPEKPRYESFAEIRKNLNMSLHPETSKHMMANPEIQPCLIREVFTSPTAPDFISKLIDSSFTYQSTSNFYAALRSLIKAKTQWLSYEKADYLKPEVELFFEMAMGAIYESCKKDELALGQYFSCKAISDRLGFNSPDRALIFCGLGSVLTHLGQYKLALRSYLMAKKIRERCIGGDSVETATVYNNLGVNMYHLSRFPEAFAYFELSEAIFTMMLGPHHNRTLLVKQSISRVKRQNILAAPSFKVLWAKQLEDPFPKRIKKNDKKKKGKK